MGLFVFAGMSKTYGVGIQFPREPVSLAHSGVNKLLPTAGPTQSFQTPSFCAAQAQSSTKLNCMPCMCQNPFSICVCVVF